MEFHHVSVLLNECIENLNIKPDGVYVDCTMGGAGHSKEIVKRLSDKGLFIGFDQDKNAIAKLKMLIEPFVLRRTKQEVLKELPEKTVTILNRINII